MNHLWRVFAILFCLLLAIVACHPPPMSSERTTARDFHLLVVAPDDVALQRAGWTGAVPIGVGATLGAADLLETEGEALVLCSDLSVSIVRNRQTPACPRDEVILENQGAQYQVRLRAADADFPYILYPRATLVLDSRPPLHWHDTGAQSYRVALKDADRGQEVWSKSGITGGTMAYPDDEPALQSGKSYRLVVGDEISGRSSDEEGIPGRAFRLVSRERQATIDEERRRILEEERLHGHARELALAIYYATFPAEDGFGLDGEAWRLLEPLAEQAPTARVNLWLGDTLSELQLGAEAMEVYQEATKRAEERGDIEAQAEAQAGLWRVTGDQAHFDEAVRLYQSLGDEAQVSAMQEDRETRE